MELKEICSKYVGFLRALYLLHQGHHWISAGANFYSNHLLFERIYKTAQENADLAAEKFVGLFGSESLNIEEHGKIIYTLLSQYKHSSIIQMSLDAEIDFLDFSKKIYEFFKKENQLSLGLDDMLMSIASEREGSVYLLKQSLGNDMNKVTRLANTFKIKLAQTANKTAPSVPNPNAGPQNGAEAQIMVDNLKLQSIGEDVKNELASSLTLQNLQPDDLKFNKLRFVTSTDNKKSIEWSLAVSPRILQQFQSGVNKHRKANPSFSTATYVTQLFNQKMPGVPVLMAQPIVMG